MNTSLVLGAIWVIAASVTAILPVSKQTIPGVILIATAPFVLGWIAYDHGWPWFVFGVFAFVSMFRKPLIYIARRALGLPVDDPRSSRI